MLLLFLTVKMQMVRRELTGKPCSGITVAAVAMRSSLGKRMGSQGMRSQGILCSRKFGLSKVGASYLFEQGVATFFVFIAWMVGREDASFNFTFCFYF